MILCAKRGGGGDVSVGRGGGGEEESRQPGRPGMKCDKGWELLSDLQGENVVLDAPQLTENKTFFFSFAKGQTQSARWGWGGQAA